MSGTLGAQMDQAKQPKKRKATSDDKTTKKPAKKAPSTEPDKPNFQKLPHKEWSIVNVVWETPYAMSDEEIAELEDPRMKHFSKLLVKHKNSDTPCFELMFRSKEPGKYIVANKKKQLVALKNATFADGTKLTQDVVFRLNNRYPRSSTSFYRENPVCGIISDRWAETLSPFKNAGVTNRAIRNKPLRFKDKIAQALHITAPPVPAECADESESEEASEESGSDGSSSSDGKELVDALYLDEMGVQEEKMRALDTESNDKNLLKSSEQTKYHQVLERAHLGILVDSAKDTMRGVPGPRDKSPKRASDSKKKKTKKATPAQPAKEQPAKSPKKPAKQQPDKKEPVKKAPAKERAKPVKKDKAAKKQKTEAASSNGNDFIELTFRINKESQTTGGKFPLGTKEHVSAESLSNLYSKVKDDLDKHMDRKLYEELRDTEYTLEEFFKSPLLRRHALPLFYSLDAFDKGGELFHADAANIELDQLAVLSLVEFPNLNVDTQETWHVNFRQIFNAIYRTRDPSFLERGTFLQHWERVGQWALQKRLGADIAQMFYDPSAIVRCWAGFFTDAEIANYKKHLLKHKNELLAVVHLWNTKEEAATAVKEEEEDVSLEDDLLDCM